jgi:hypothetical protein
VFACGGPAEVPTALRALRETVGSGLRTDHSAMAAA